MMGCDRREKQQSSSSRQPCQLQEKADRHCCKEATRPCHSQVNPAAAAWLIAGHDLIIISAATQCWILNVWRLQDSSTAPARC